MSEYVKVAMRIFNPATNAMMPYFSNLKPDLRRAKIRMSIQEYLASGIFLSFLIFVIEVPLLSFIFAIGFGNPLFGFITSFTISFFLTIIFFLSYVNYPKVLIKNREKNIENVLPFASLHLSTIASSKLPLHKVFEIFSKYATSGDLADEIAGIRNDIKLSVSTSTLPSKRQ